MLKKNKPKAIEDLKKTISNYKIIGLISMNKLPAKQLQDIKKKLDNIAKIKMSKKVIINKALEQSNIRNKEELLGKLEGSMALIFSNENPFKVYKIAKDNKSPAKAKAGDTAEKDIEIKAGPTSLPAGPAITQLQSIGLKTRVDGGKITISESKTVVKKGDKITNDMANVFTMLGLEPMEVGLNIKYLMDDGILYNQDVLDIDEKEFNNNLLKAVQHGINLSMNINYITKLNSKLLIQKAFKEAKELCLAANIISKDYMDDLLLKAVKEAMILKNYNEK